MAEQGQSPENGEVCDLDTHILGELAGEIQSDKAVDRMHAVSVLGRFGSGPGALEALKHITSDDKDPDVRKQARLAYDRLKARVAAPLASEMRIRKKDGSLDLPRFLSYISVPNPIYRIEAVLEAVASGDKAALPAMLDRLSRENDEWVVATLIRAVGGLGDGKYVPLLVPFLEWDAHPRVISNTIESLAKLDIRQAAPEIAKLVEHRDGRVQAAAVVALYAVEPDAARVCLQAMAHAPNPGQRMAAAHCMARLHDQACVDMLYKMASEEKDEATKAKIQTLADNARANVTSRPGI